MDRQTNHLLLTSTPKVCKDSYIINHNTDLSKRDIILSKKDIYIKRLV